MLNYIEIFKVIIMTNIADINEIAIIDKGKA